jgi:hemoglobin-like flavoprotein
VSPYFHSHILTTPLVVHTPDITDTDINLAKSVWSSIIEDRSPLYLEEKMKDSNFPHSSCISWFYSIFYDRLFNVHPMCRPLFTSGIVSQGKFLVKMVTFILNSLKHRSKFTTAMQELAKRHCERGIRGVEYGIVGDVLFYSLQKTTGILYTLEVEIAWKKIFSSMLAVIVPLCVEYERTGVVNCEIERVSDSGALLDSAAIAALDADKNIASQTNSKLISGSRYTPSESP